MTEQQLDRKDLKIQALRETVNQLQEAVSDLRVELTINNITYQENIRNLNEQLESQKSESEEEPDGEIVDDVQEEDKTSD